MPFTPALLLSELNDLRRFRRIVVGFSGGMDSVVLLDALLEGLAGFDAGLKSRVRAIHINHQLSPSADAWQRFCEEFCAARSVPIRSRRVTLDPESAGNLEEQARDARYAVFASLLADEDCLLLAHHLDDQVETFVQRLLRGAGIRGMAAMPQSRSLNRACIQRPLLAFPRSDLEQFARSRKLQWVEDESNADTRFDRNFLRHQLLPLIERRWPQYRERLHHSISIGKEAAALMAEIAAEDRAVVESRPGALELSALRKLSEPRRRNLLVYWLAASEMGQPSKSLIARLSAMIEVGVEGQAERSKTPQIEHGGFLFFLLESCLCLIKAPGGIDTEARYLWRSGAAEVALPENGRIHVRSEGMSSEVGGRRIVVAYRRGGQKLRIRNRGSKSLKNLLQENAVPPWLRSRQPLVFVDEEFACVPGIAVDEKFEALLGSEQAFVWEPPQLSAFDKNLSSHQVSD